MANAIAKAMTCDIAKLWFTKQFLRLRCEPIFSEIAFAIAVTVCERALNERNFMETASN